MHVLAPLRLVMFAALAALAGCSMSHGNGEDAGVASLGDGGGGGGGGSDSGGGWSVDSGGPGPGPVPGHLADASGPLPIDASSFPRPDAMPPRHDAMPPGDRSGDVWAGYVESHEFPSGSDSIRIVFDSATGDGPRTGIVVFGDGEPPPPVSNPNVGYPSSFDPLFGPPNGPFEGFEYPIASATVSLGGTRVQVRVQLSVLWTEWCELQSSYPFDASGESWACVPNTGTSTGETCALHLETGEWVPIDCGKLALCHVGGVCECNSAGCTSGHAGEVQIDFSVSGTRGDGTVELSGSRNIHVVRAP